MGARGQEAAVIRPEAAAASDGSTTRRKRHKCEACNVRLNVSGTLTACRGLGESLVLVSRVRHVVTMAFRTPVRSEAAVAAVTVYARHHGRCPVELCWYTNSSYVLRAKRFAPSHMTLVRRIAHHVSYWPAAPSCRTSARAGEHLPPSGGPVALHTAARPARCTVAGAGHLPPQGGAAGGVPATLGRLSDVYDRTLGHSELP